QRELRHVHDTSPASVTTRFSFISPAPHRDLHSFPTRRSSDLESLSLATTKRPPTWSKEPGKLPQSTWIIRSPCQTGTRYFFPILDRKSTRLNSSHRTISYAVFCLKKKKITEHNNTTTNHVSSP